MIRNHLNVRVFCVLMLVTVAGVRADSDGETPVRPKIPTAVTDAAGQGMSKAPTVNRAKQIRMLKQFEGEVSRTLKMDEDESTELADIFRDFIDGLNEYMQSAREAKREKAEVIRELVDEMRDAQQDQDVDRVQEIRREISELRNDHDGEPEALDHEALYEEIRELLTEEQVDQFEPLAERFTKRLAGPKAQGKSKAKLYRKAVNSIDLAEEQRAQIRRIFVEASKQARNPRTRGKAEATEEADEELLDSILDELDEDQAREFMRKVNDLERMHRGERVVRRRAGRDEGARKRRTAADREIMHEEEVEEELEEDEIELSKHEEMGEEEDGESEEEDAEEDNAETED